MQIDAMRTHFPSLRLIVNHPGIKIWEGDIQPLSTSYTIRVTDQRGIDDGEMIMPFEFPQVTVKAPQLTRRDDDPSRPIPHLYGPDDDPRGVRLCLFYPDGDEWTRSVDLGSSVLARRPRRNVVIRLAAARSSLERDFSALAVSSIGQAKALLYIVERAGRLTSGTHVLEHLLGEIDVLHIFDTALDDLAQVKGLGTSGGGGKPIEPLLDIRCQSDGSSHNEESL
jgi:hypothetical protein